MQARHVIKPDFNSFDFFKKEVYSIHNPIVVSRIKKKGVTARKKTDRQQREDTKVHPVRIIKKEDEKTQAPPNFGERQHCCSAPTLLLQARPKQEHGKPHFPQSFPHQSLLRNPDFEPARSLVPVT
jgi:hypothetical protein